MNLLKSGNTELQARFMAEAHSLILPDQYSKQATVQALAVMFLVDAGSSKALCGLSYLHLAVSIMLQQDFKEHINKEAWQLTLSGVHTLEKYRLSLLVSHCRLADTSQPVDGVHVQQRQCSVTPCIQRLQACRYRPGRPCLALLLPHV